MPSEKQTAIFTFIIITIMIFAGVNVVESVSPPNESDIQLVKLDINNSSHSITENNIYVNEGYKIIPKVKDKESAEWINIKSLSNDPDIEIINNTVYTKPHIECDPDPQPINKGTNSNYEIERYKIEYAGDKKWLNFYCVKE